MDILYYMVIKMRTIIITILIGLCASCGATKKIPPIYENENCSVTLTPGKLTLKIN